MAAYKKAKDSATADGLVDSALKQATTVPLRVAERAAELLQIIDSLRPITSPNMKSDLVTAAALARAAIEGALANVEINLESLQDKEFVAQTRRRTAALAR
jgi:glutamate formiminotransferase/formiminotetrahydrofolate cyclodeaminase